MLKHNLQAGWCRTVSILGVFPCSGRDVERAKDNTGGGIIDANSLPLQQRFHFGQYRFRLRNSFVQRKIGAAGIHHSQSPPT
jgi:hypothetical protein